MAWVITFEGTRFAESSLTMDEAERMEVATNTTWRFINPLRSAGHARAILETLLVTREGLADDEAKKKVGAVPVNEFLRMLSEEDDDADLPTQYEDGFPQPAAGTSTPT